MSGIADPAVPCLVRAGTRQGALDGAPAWCSAGITGVLIPPPWQTDAPRHARCDEQQPFVAQNADLSDVPGETIASRIASTAAALRHHGLDCYLELRLDEVVCDAPTSTVDPGWLRALETDPALDPRLPRGTLRRRRLLECPPAAFVQAWLERLSMWLDHGIRGLILRSPEALAPPIWHALIHGLRVHHPDALFIAWTPGMSPTALQVRRFSGFDHTVSSLAWWDGSADWLAEEDARLRELAPVLAYAGSRHDSRWLWAAAVSGDGLIVDAGPDLASRIAPVLRWRHETALIGPICTIGGHGGRATALLRSTPGSGRVLLALAPDPGAPALLDMGAVAAVVPSGTPLRQDAEKAVIAETPIWIDGQALLRWQAPATVQATRHAHPLAGATQSSQARIGIERLTPNVDGGAWPVKRISHEALDVEADIFTDGHLHLAADLCWRAVDEVHWQRVAMSPQGNDRWHARCRPQRLGRHEYCIQAWVDTWTGMCADWQARHEAGQDLTLSLHEGEQWLSHILKGLGRGAADKGRRAAARQALSTLRLILRHPGPEADIEPLLDEGLAAILRDPGEQPFCTLSAPFPLQVDRALAGFGQWYTLFPRSQSSDANRHGTFDDVIERLPDIRRMGFDVLYLTPIHPVGLQNRKGRNNTLIAQEGDVGSPYAIGADEGGHTAIHPQLGSLEDFQRLVNQARDCDLEVALDFAIQCSPDHPWLRDHPDWFSWRPDGSLRHAENPPKKYEDIVNVVFYDDAPAHARKDALWETLRDVVMFWVDQGVRLFRVDNPHTKPLPFWQWLIADVQARAPDVVFLSEAFTRPAMMYRLAKLGFTQSYTYFTWRNDPRELGRYLQALSSPPLVDFFRPNFFVNTPDINPFYLQRHGRPGFLARAALAATGAGLWGIYSGFELCESAPLPGREEYMDSEKYELRPRQWLAPGHIRDEIAQLNAIRSANPALHGVRGFQSLAATPDSVLAYLRTSADRGNIVLVLVNLDPQRTVDARVSLGTSLPIDNLLAGTIERWDDGWMQVRLTPEAPYRLWRLPAAPVVAPSSSEPESTHA